MSFQPPITVQKAVEHIHARKYLLPAIQREFVWNTGQIEQLFDSLLRGYPIGSFLFWSVTREHSREYQFYEFIKDVHARDAIHNPKASIVGDEDFTAILDGQQRLTSLYVGLRGSYAAKEKYGRWENDASFPRRRLYLNLLREPTDADRKYDFRFLTDEEVAADTGPNSHWFVAGRVLDFKSYKDGFDYLIKNEIATEHGSSCMSRLWEAIRLEPVITHFLEEEQDLDKVLDIFIRMNSGGTKLSYSDLLLSTATAQWKSLDAREEIHGLVEELNQVNRFHFDKDFVLKACLVIGGLPDIRYKVTNFTRENMDKIEKAWPDIERSLRQAVLLVGSFGFEGQTLTSANAVIPIAHYLFRRGCPTGYVESAKHRDDREAVRQWLLRSLLRGLFGGHADRVHAVIRDVVDTNHEQFPGDLIAQRLLTIGKSLRFEAEEIDALLFSKYQQKDTFAVLALLSPTLDLRNHFHQDHVHPRSTFKKKALEKAGVAPDDIDFCLEHCDYIPNLQLLEGVPNQEKSATPFETWLATTYASEADQRAYRERHNIPGGSLALGSFKEFFMARRELLASRLRVMLKEPTKTGTI
ncbi:MAG: DUF262 domain-containing protein [Vicinamibacterales bacterium]